MHVFVFANSHNLEEVVYDCARTIDRQERMIKTLAQGLCQLVDVIRMQNEEIESLKKQFIDRFEEN